MEKHPIEHPILGTVRWDSSLQRWEAEVVFLPDHKVWLSLDPEIAYQIFVEPSILFDIGAGHLAWAREHEGRCRELIAEELLQGYNESWASEDPREGPGIRTRAEFIDNFQLGSISWGSTSGRLPPGLQDPQAVLARAEPIIAWYFEDRSDLFAGHTVTVWVKNGNFHNPHLAG